MEEWKDIEGYEGLYQVSNLGRVKRFYKNGKERILKPRINNRFGYLCVVLYKDGKGKDYRVHRLVGKHFIPNPKDLPCINHIDECKTNNQVDNLEWCTVSYNNTYGTRLERISEARKGIKFSEETKKKMSKARKDKKMVMAINKESGHIFIFQSIKQASEELGILKQSISKCCRGKGRLKSTGGYTWEYI